MATTFADLEARVRGLESRAQRAEEDITALITTVVEVRDDVRQLARDVRWTRRALTTLLRAQGLDVPPEPEQDESDL
nr:hypothetical protein [Micromonospora sp. DSM 115978]